MSLVASLGMYDLPHLRSANDRLWAAIAARLRRGGLADVPDRLDRDRPLEDVWDDPGLLLAQTCGYPLMTRWRDRLTYVATPVYACGGGGGHRHRSRFVVRDDDPARDLSALAGRRAAVNDRGSNTGMNLLRGAVAPLSVGGRFFAEIVVTGSHASSLKAVADGAADVAAIDAITFDHVAHDDPALAGRMRTIGWSRSVPNLPFVTAVGTDPAVVELVRVALAEAVRDGGEAARTLRLRSVAVITFAEYGVVGTIEDEARDLGYPVLA